MIWIVLWGLVLFVLSIISPFFGLITYMGILYLRPMEVYPILAPYHIARVFAIAIILGFLIRYGGKRRIFFNFKQDKILFCLLIVIILSFSVGWIPKCLEVFEQMAKNVIIYALIVKMVNSERKLKILIWALLIMSGVLAFNAVQTFNTIDTIKLDYGRLGGFSGAYFGDSNDFALMMNTVIPFAFILTISARPFILRPAALWLIAMFVTSVVASRSRGGIITFGVITLGLSYFGLKAPRGWQKFISVVLIIGTIVGMFAFAPSVFKERAETILDYQHQVTVQSRIDYWKIGIKMFLGNPLIGVGAGNYQIKYHDFGGWERQWRVPHSMYIDILSGLGILGFGCLFFLLYFTFKDSIYISKILREKKKTNSFLYMINQAALLSLVAYCVGGMFLSISTYPIFYIIIAIIVAIKNTTVLSLKESR